MIDVLKRTACVLASLQVAGATGSRDPCPPSSVDDLARQVPPRPRFSVVDRLIFIWLYRLRPSAVDAVSIVRPQTVLWWHQVGSRRYWRWKSRSTKGR
jgi:hypothetical protein